MKSHKIWSQRPKFFLSSLLPLISDTTPEELTIGYPKNLYLFNCKMRSIQLTLCNNCEEYICEIISLKVKAKILMTALHNLSWHTSGPLPFLHQSTIPFLSHQTPATQTFCNFSIIRHQTIKHPLLRHLLLFFVPFWNSFLLDTHKIAPSPQAHSITF